MSKMSIASTDNGEMLIKMLNFVGAIGQMSFRNVTFPMEMSVAEGLFERRRVNPVGSSYCVEKSDNFEKECGLTIYVRLSQEKQQK